MPLMFGTFDKRLARLAALLFLVTCAACQPQRFHLACGLPPLVGKTLQNSLQQVPLTVDSAMVGSGAALQALLQGHADLAIIQNDFFGQPTPGSPLGLTQIRTVHHLFSGYLLIIHRPDISASSLPELLQGRRVGLNSRNSGTGELFRQLVNHFQVDTTRMERIYVNNSEAGPQALGKDYDVFVMISALPNPFLSQTLRETGGVVFNLDDPTYQGMGDALEGLAQQNSLVRATRVARYALGPEPTEPVQTLEVDFVLVSHSHVSPSRIYDLVTDLHQSHELMARAVPAFRQIAQPANTANFQFPLHEGTLQYLNRDKPNFFQENAEVTALLITLIGLTYTSFRSVLFGRQRSARNRIEYWYAKVRALEADALMVHPGQLPQLAAELDQIRTLALDELQAERLAADASFLIFLQLHDRVQTILAQRQQVD